MQKQEKIPLAAKTGYRYYLVWITSLPPRNNYVAINEIALYQLTH